MHRFRSLLILMPVVLLVLGLHYRYQLQEMLFHCRDQAMAMLHLQAAARTGQPDVLYTWVDKNGVTHFEQQKGGTRVEYDGNRITPLPPADPVQLAAADAANAADQAAKAAAAEGAVSGDQQPAGGGGGLVPETTRELHRNIQKMRAAKAARDGL